MKIFKNEKQLLIMHLKCAKQEENRLIEERNSLNQKSSELWQLATEFHNMVSWSILIKKFELTLKLTES